MATLKNLLAQKASIDKQIQQARRKERTEAISSIRSLMEQFDLTVADLSGKVSTKASGRKSPIKGRKVAPKFRNAETGETWSGRGLQPKWLKTAIAAGRKLEDFAI